MNKSRILVQVAQFESHILRDFWNPTILTKRKRYDRIVSEIKKGGGDVPAAMKKGEK